MVYTSEIPDSSLWQAGLVQCCTDPIPSLVSIPRNLDSLLSLSRLNHRLPWGQAHPEVMQGTTEFHHHIADAVLPQPDAVFHDAAAPDAPVHRLDPQAAMVQGLVRELLLHRQLLATGVLRRHEDLDLGQRKRQEAQIL